jgi:hypothetical protein
MNAAQKHAQEILPLVKAQANGEVIQQYVESHGWIDCTEPTAFVNGCKYRTKPKTILVNGFEVPEPMRVAPESGRRHYHIPAIDDELFYLSFAWRGTTGEEMWLSRGLCHSTKEAAIAHAKAMLGVDPKDGE